MLDVHPPHEAAHSWQDFLIHIATIVVGLLIAVGLEQSVEWVHHRSEVHETRRTLAREKKANRADSGIRAEEFKRFTVILERDLQVFLYLQKHPAAAPEQWPGKLNWATIVTSFKTSAWETAVKSNVIAYMPQAEVQTLALDYALIEECRVAQRDLDHADQDARSYTIAEPDASKLPPAEIDAQVKAVIRLLRYQYVYGQLLKQVADNNPGFRSPSQQDIYDIIHTVPDPDVARDIQAERSRRDQARKQAAAEPDE